MSGNAVVSSNCDISGTSVIIETSGYKYRFFNQPIEQIPGFDPDRPQILAHGANGGLVWHNVNKCLPVVTCISLDTVNNKLQIDTRQIVVIGDFEPSTGTLCQPIDLTTC